MVKRRSLLVGAGAGAVLSATGLHCKRDDEVSSPSKTPSKPPPQPPETLPEKLAEALPERPPVTPILRSRPNVLLVAIDDMKPWVGTYGYTEAHTPNMDALTGDGMVFTKAYCAAPACSPSRAAVFTGQAPNLTGCYFNRQNWNDHSPALTTLPRLYRESGYITAGFGKLFHSKHHDDKSAWDERRHHHLMRLPKGAPLNVPESIWRKAGSRFDWAPVDVPVESMDDHKQVNATIDAMKRFDAHPKGRPWFIATGLFRPHLPWYVPRRFFDLHPLESIKLPPYLESDLDDVPKRGRSMAKQEEHRVLVSKKLWRPAVQAYMASIAYADYELGRLLNAVSDDTVVLIWSDHGWHLGPKNHWHKYALWEEASRTVFAMRGPDIVTGTHCQRTVSLNDIYPTLTELSGLQAPHELSGRSVVPLTRDPKAPWDRPAVTTYGANNHGVRDERYRYIRYEDGGEELYDHKSDPNEWTNLASKPEMQPVIASLAEHLPSINVHLNLCHSQKNQDRERHRKDQRREKRRQDRDKRREKRREKRGAALSPEERASSVALEDKVSGGPRVSGETWVEVDGRRVLVPVS